jgi:Tfp pilus assembly PilM family ATPase
VIGVEEGKTTRRGGYRAVRRWLSRTLLEPEYPLVAVEVRPRAVGAVRLVREGSRVALGAATAVEVPDGVLEVSLTRPNIADPAAFSTVLRTALERVGALEGGAVSVVLPDPAVRLALVSTEGLKGRSREAEEMIRFRLHRALPFDVRAARLAWDGTRDEQALVAVALSDVVGGYEEALEALGLHPGLVEASTLALASLGELEVEEGDRLLVNWDDSYVSFLLRRGPRPLLVRTLPGETGAQNVARQAASTLQFHRERLGGEALREVVLRSAAIPGDQAMAALEPVLGCEPRLLRPWAALGGVESDLAAQAVAGAAASALRRVA